MSRFIPRETKFFDLFADMANNLTTGARQLRDLLQDYTDVSAGVQRIKGTEHKGDDIAHAVFVKLNSSFITPFDREDIHTLASSLDDVLDYTSDDQTLGKRVGDDLADGNLTLPLIYALQHGEPEEQALVKHVLATANLEELPRMKALLERCGAMAYTFQQAQAYTQKALEALSHFPSSSYREALQILAEFNLERSH